MQDFIKKTIISGAVIGVLFIGQIAVARISNPGGSGTASQTPWTSDIAAATYDLLNLGKVGVGTSSPYSVLDIYNEGGNSESGITFDSGTTLGRFYIYHDGGALTIGAHSPQDGSENPLLYFSSTEISIGNDAAFSPDISIGSGYSTTTFDGTMVVPTVENGCTSDEAGAIMFDGTNFQGCNGTAWVQLDNAI